jgi:hypothetical protein
MYVRGAGCWSGGGGGLCGCSEAQQAEACRGKRQSTYIHAGDPVLVIEGANTVESLSP